MAAVTRVRPSTSLGRFSGAVANSAMSTHRSRWTSTRMAASLGRATALATPMAAWASSTSPQAAGAGWSLATRPPKSRPVVPSSPVRV